MLESKKDLIFTANLVPDERIIPRCPNCGESYYAELYSETTCLGWTPIYKDGVLMNSNPNKTTTHCECMNCGHRFSIKR